MVRHNATGITGRELGSGCSWVWSLVPMGDADSALPGFKEKGALKAGEKESFVKP